ncbi:phytanoyl-CoA dioxygenase family protein [Thauera aminoaromatica]|uniref:Phytanoyl-CoA dioxygenase family protein n=1 Tax=Thauera aminoaromatica TaxID=164330 RepID=A0A5C7S3C9_THASP|nr:phytanoyl-CoA dioxygenase family protein [Thauera aminoaromatica]TXH78384.1 MAG: hypothetical protein E6Q80_22840 [Thauera aminoaromatica]
MNPQHYASNGYARLSSAIDAGAAHAAARWIVDNRTRVEVPHTLDALDRRNQLPIKLRRLWDCDPDFWSGFVMRSGVLEVASRWLGEEFLLIRSAAFIKYPGSRATVGWHCDEHLWGYECEAGLTVWIPLTLVPPQSGCLQFIPGSHLRPPGRLYWDIRHPYHKVMDVTGFEPPVSVPVEVGDCIVMDKRTVHASGPNQSGAERIGLVFAFARCAPERLTESAVGITRGGCFHAVPAGGSSESEHGVERH